ncbi:MAG: acyltransferase domain-containing protein [Xanthobacteraceae bacterium]|nr:acyltransferase domain-containing protein [Xanthobacteraceae bacterium]
MTLPLAANDGAELSPVKRALLEIRELRSRIATFELASSEPIAIVGLGCRLPGGITDAQSMWRVLQDGVDTIGQVPENRWDADSLFDADPDSRGTMATRYGGFLDDVDRFDAMFFGISPREAASMDPQQRLMLEVNWLALENAGIAPDSLAGSPTGVFVGVGNSDYSRLLFRERDQIDAYAGSGSSASMIPGRLSYHFGLRGPSIAVDTACSASLVAAHLACQSLRRGECDLALAGGVNLILGPEAHIAFTKARMMAPDGRCKTFDARANGYGRGEGAAVIVLRRLSDATARGDRIWALIRGSAVNQDGRSAGVTAPNGPAQVEVIRSALKDARLVPEQIDYVEAHGTGTSLGDPIELQAIMQALGANRSTENPLLVGSSKTNFGHLEAAAGITGLIKTVLSLAHGKIPPHLHFETPNPMLDWDTSALRVTTALQDWPKCDGPGRAGVSSFGFSGTNAHVLLEQAPARAANEVEAASVDRPRHLLALSATTKTALRELACRFIERIDGEPVDPADLCWSANTGRAHFAQRLAVTGVDVGELRAGLQAYVDGRSVSNMRAGDATQARPVVGMLFTGQGAQRIDMGRGLYAASPTFRTAFDACAEALNRVTGTFCEQSLISIVYPESEARSASVLDQTAIAQPALFALECALASLWRRWGIEPAVVLGHSVGEVAAAVAGGVMDMTTGSSLIAARATLMQSLPAGGAMATVFALPMQVKALLADHAVEIAALNAPNQLVISGAEADVDAVCLDLSERGIQSKRLVVSHAFHSRAMEPILAAFQAETATLQMNAPRITVISNVTGEAADPGLMSGRDYWRRHIRNPVQFEASMHSAASLGITHFLEIGPAPVLLGMAAASVELPAESWLPSLHPGNDDWDVILGALQALYVAGVDINWQAFDADYRRSRVDLPSYPFEGRRYWFEVKPAQETVEDAAHVWRSVKSSLDHQAELAPIGVDLTNYEAKWASLAQLTTVSASEVLRGAGIFAVAGERATLDTVRARLGAADAHDHLLRRWLDLLVRSGALRREQRAEIVEYIADQPIAAADIADHMLEVARHLEGNQPLLAYIAHCSALLPDVIAGRVSPLETLFPEGSFDLAEGLYQHSATARYINALAASALQAFATARTTAGSLRILEVGAGTGSTTAGLLNSLPDDTEYTFSDVSEFFLDRARDKFAACAQFSFHRFDLDCEAAEQGFGAASFDVIVAANVVHATPDLRKSLMRLRELLAPGGLLLLLESTRHLDWFDMSTGLIEGWQSFNDDLRVDGPLLPPERWLQVLRAAGFHEADAWPRAGSVAEAIGQHLIVARSPVGGIAKSIGNVTVKATPAASPPGRSMPDSMTASAAVWRGRFHESPVSEQDGLLRDLVRQKAMQVLRLADDQTPGPNDRLMDLGFDSLMAVQLRGLLGEALGLSTKLPATLLFDHPTIAAIASFLAARLGPSVTDAPQLPAAQQSNGSVEREAEIASMSDEGVEELLMQRLRDQ